MGRRQTIDRSDLLDAAERVVLGVGATGLTIDAVAKEAGVSKGGVLYTFATKDALIDAMMARVVEGYDKLVRDFMETSGHVPDAAARAHIEASRREDETTHQRATAIMASLIRAPEFHDRTKAFYRELFDTTKMSSETARRVRLALLATEGAYMVRGFGFYSFTDEAWQAVHDDILSILLPLG